MHLQYNNRLEIGGGYCTPPIHPPSPQDILGMCIVQQTLYPNPSQPIPTPTRNTRGGSLRIQMENKKTKAGAEENRAVTSVAARLIRARAYT